MPVLAAVDKDSYCHVSQQVARPVHETELMLHPV